MNQIDDTMKNARAWHGPQQNGAASNGATSSGAAGDAERSPRPPAAKDTSAERGDGNAAENVTHWPRYGGGPALIAGDPCYGRANDEFQALAALLQSLAAAQSRHIFAVTSARAREGKSFVALNLSAKLARGGARVLLIDADLRSHSRRAPLGPDASRGSLLGYLMERNNFESSLHDTWLPGLALVPAGAAVAADSGRELFGSSRMRKFMEAVRAAYGSDFVVIDCPPALTASETRIAAHLADALLLVMAANRTPRDAVARALSQLAGATLAALVLNRFEPSYSRKAEYQDPPGRV